MSWTRSLGRYTRRSEVRLGVALAASMSALLLGLLGLLFFVASHEAAEVAHEALHDELRDVAARLASGHQPSRFRRSPSGASLRLVEAQGGAVALYGEWPSEGRLFPPGASTVRLASASPSDHFLERLELPAGEQLEGAAPMAEFVKERREQMRQLALSFTLGLLGVVGIAAYATRRALAPLRTTTLALEHVDERRLSERIPTRGTEDDVDRHAAALNRVLARLEASFARMAAFSADVAHELRTPINRILNQADVALLSGDPHALGQTLETVRATAEEMARVVEDMLLLARGDEGRLPVRPEPLKLGEVVGDLVELYRPSCEERRVALSVLERDDPGEIVTDPHLLQRAVSNLLDNALRHTPEGGRIELAIERDRGRARIAVSDSGAGVPEADRARIFERFAQLDPARRSGGAGLGLPIARMIARVLGGELTVAGSALGGARFSLELPALGAQRTDAAGGR
jgi:signal transduction histidine kinase